MSGTARGAKKAAKKNLAKDPEYYKKLAKRSTKPRGGAASPGSFKKGNRHGLKGGARSKRGSGKAAAGPGHVLDGYKLEYEDM